MGGAVFPPVIYLGPKYGGGNEDNGDFLQKVLCVCPQPCSRPLPTHASTGDSWTLLDKSGSVSCGVSAPFLGSWCTQGSVCVRQEFVSQSCVSSGGSIVGLVATSSKRAYVISGSAAPRVPAPVAVPCWPVPPQETFKHSSVSVSVGSLGPGAYKVCLSPLNVSDGNGVWF